MPGRREESPAVRPGGSEPSGNWSDQGTKTMLRLRHTALLVFAFAIAVAAEPSRTGTVTAGSLNVRAKAARHFERIGKFERGDTVQVVGEDNEWLEVIVPPDAKAWVARQHLDGRGAVTATTLLVRSGPGIVFTPYAEVPQGTELKLIGPPMDEWQQILPPPDATGWVSRAYVRIQEPAPHPEPVVVVVEPEPEPEPVVVVEEPEPEPVVVVVETEPEPEPVAVVEEPKPEPAEQATATPPPVQPVELREAPIRLEPLPEPAEYQSPEHPIEMPRPPDGPAEVAAVQPEAATDDTLLPPKPAPAAATRPKPTADTDYLPPVMVLDAPTLARPTTPPIRYETQIFVAEAKSPEPPGPPVEEPAAPEQQTVAIAEPQPDFAQVAEPEERRRFEGLIFSLRDEAVPEASHLLYRREGTVSHLTCYLRSDHIPLEQWEMREVILHGELIEIPGWSRPVLDVRGIQLKTLD